MSERLLAPAAADPAQHDQTPTAPAGPVDAHDAVVVQAGERRSARVESLRAVAALAVLVSHVFLYAHHFGPSSFDSFLHRTIAGGGFGVQLFFALSGFLIFRPFARRDFGDGAPIDLRTYARNRAVRILPLYWSAVVLLLIFTQDGGSLGQWWKFTLFGHQFFSNTGQTVDAPMWSVIVELHFYLLLPLLAWLLARACRGHRGRAAVVLVVVGAVSTALRRYDPDPKVIWEYSFPATFYGFVPGMLLALLQLEWQERRPAWLRGIVERADVWFAASAGVWLVTFWHYDWAIPLTAMAAFLTVGAVVLPLHDGRLVRTLDWRPLALVGVASYSLYIWHVPIIEQLYGHSSLSSFPRLLVVAVPLALLAAAISYMVIERPALTLRRRWASGTAAPAREQETAATSATGRASALAPLAAARRGWTRFAGNERWLAPVLVIAFLARARTVMATRHLVLGGDASDYDRLGRLLAAGKGFGTSVLSPSGGPTAFRPPLYPMFLGVVYKVTGNSILAARFAQALLGVATVALVWLLAKRLFGPGVALAAACIAAVYPPLIFATEALLSESLFIPIMLLGFYAALVARDGGPRANQWALVAGVCAGLGVLTRPNSLAMLPALLLLVAAWSRGGWQRRPALVRVACVVVAAVVVIVPWQVRNVVVMHSFVPISDIDGYNFAGVYNADAASSPSPTRYQFRPPNGVTTLAPLFADTSLDEVSLGSKLRTSGIDFIKDHPTAPVKAEAWNTYRMLELAGLDESTLTAREGGYGRSSAAIGMVAFWLLLGFAVAGAFTALVRRAPLALWFAPVCLWALTALFLGDPRLRSPIDVFLVLSAAPAVELVAQQVAGRVRSLVERPAQVAAA